MPRTECSNDFLKVELTGYLWMHYRRFSLFDKDELHMPVFKSYLPVKILMLSVCIFIMTCNIFFLRDFTRRVEQPGFLLSVCQEWFASQLKRDGVWDAELPTNLRQKWALLSSLYLLRNLHLVFLRHPVELKKERKKNYSTHTHILSIKAADTYPTPKHCFRPTTATQWWLSLTASAFSQQHSRPRAQPNPKWRSQSHQGWAGCWGANHGEAPHPAARHYRAAQEIPCPKWAVKLNLVSS